MKTSPVRRRRSTVLLCAVIIARHHIASHIKEAAAHLAPWIRIFALGPHHSGMPCPDHYPSAQFGLRYLSPRSRSVGRAHIPRQKQDLRNVPHANNQARAAGLAGTLPGEVAAVNQRLMVAAHRPLLFLRSSCRPMSARADGWECGSTGMSIGASSPACSRMATG